MAQREQVLGGKKALVTGGSRGIGAAIVRLLAADGATVAIHYRQAAATAEQLRASLPGRRHVALAADLEDPAAAAALPQRAAEALGGLDIVVNNAGIYERHAPLDTEPEEWLTAWNRTMQVNLVAPAAICHGAARLMLRGGHIVNISSRGAFRGEPEAPAYGAAKAGLNSLSQSLALALAPRGIHVVAVAPGWVESDMTRPYLDGPEGEAIRAQSPLHRTATPEEIAEVVRLAVSGRADALTGAVIDVNCASYLR